MIEVVCLLLAGAFIGVVVLVAVSVAVSEPPPPVERPNDHALRARREIGDLEAAAVMRMLTIAQEDSGA